MEAKRLTKVSKYLARHLRHAPERIGLELQSGGWVDVETLLAACEKHGFRITRNELEQVVAQNDKQRFSFDESSTRIRANQGHSVEVDLQLKAQTPPDVLYHGTATHIAPNVWRDGLKKMRRHHVHLSRDVETATKVGARHGKPFIFEVDAKAMSNAGFQFFCSDNGVWLCDEVPPQYLKEML
jgi:putative RNA 2'-phosphotransferase